MSEEGEFGLLARLKGVVMKSLRKGLDVEQTGAQAVSLPEFDRLKTVVLASKRVDLVDFGPIKVFMYMDDLAYQQVAEQYKRAVPSQTLFSQRSLPAIDPGAVYEDPQALLLHRLLAHYWQRRLDFTFVDVGCQYGSSAIAVAQFILQCGMSNRVIAFEPGVAGALAAHNCRINGVESILTLETLAVADGCYPTLLFTELGHSENNRVVNRTVDVEATSTVVWTTSLDGYLAGKGLDMNLIIKIDTQGGEVEVFRGMDRTMRTRHVAAITEFTPWALATRTNPADWLRQFVADYCIYDVSEWPKCCLGAEIAEPIESFVSAVSARASGYTDLLLLKRDLPGLDDLLHRLQA